MKNLLTSFFMSTAVFALMAGVAGATDLPSKAPPPAPAPDVSSVRFETPGDWNGLYAGVFGGADWMRSKSGAFTTQTVTLTDTSVTPNAVYTAPGAKQHFSDEGRARPEAGLWAGYNMTRGSFLYGVDATASWTSSRGSLVNPYQGVNQTIFSGLSIAGTEKQNWGAELRGRVGWLAMNNQVNFYGLGGVALGGFHQDAVQSWTSSAGVTNISTLSKDKAAFGYEAGVGAEGKITQRIALRGEYVFQQYAGIKTQEHKARLGVTYGF